MKSVTITLDDTVLRKARVQAAERDKSVAAFLADLVVHELEEKPAEVRRNHQTPEYEEAMREDLAETPYLDSDPSKPYPSREDLHNRAFQRRAESELRSRRPISER